MARIVTRYGLDNQRLRTILQDYVGLCNANHVTPTLPVTASVVKRCPSVFMDIQQKMDVEFAVHGYRHIDYTAFPHNLFKEHLSSSLHVFQGCRIPVTGFRFPFLRGDDSRVRILSEFGFNWDSSKAFFWKFPFPESVSEGHKRAYQTIGDSYRSAFSLSAGPYPESTDRFTEIPVSMPDDDMLLERLGMSARQIPRTVHDMLQGLESCGGIMALQLHPERFPLFKKALESVLYFTNGHSTVWKASLGQVASWCRERNRYHWTLESTGNGTYRFVEKGDSRIRILAKGFGSIRNFRTFEKDWSILPKEPVSFRSETRPVIGVHPDSAERISPLLMNEGWLFEVSARSSDYRVFLDSGFLPEFKKIEETIQKKTDEPGCILLKRCRWPHARRSCVAITGDIDAIDLEDYLVRLHG